MSKWRYTVESLASGQDRPYADSRNHVRVTFEIDDPKTGDFKLSTYVNEQWARKLLLGLNCGFTEFTYPVPGREPTADDYYRPRLDWLKQIEPGVWEFHTTTAFTD